MPKYNIKTTELFEETRLRLRLNDYERLTDISEARRESIRRIQQAIEDRHRKNKRLEAVINEEKENNYYFFTRSCKPTFFTRLLEVINPSRLSAIYDKSIQNLSSDNTEQYTDEEVRKTIILFNIKKFEFDEEIIDIDTINRIAELLKYCQELNDFPDQSKEAFIKKATAYLLKAIDTPCFYVDKKSGSHWPFNKAYIAALCKAQENLENINGYVEKNKMADKLAELQADLVEFEFKYLLSRDIPLKQRAINMANQIATGKAKGIKEDEYVIPPRAFMPYKKLQKDNELRCTIMKRIKRSYMNAIYNRTLPRGDNPLLNSCAAGNICVNREVSLFIDRGHLALFNNSDFATRKNFIGLANIFLKKVSELMRHELTFSKKTRYPVTTKYISAMISTNVSGNLFRRTLFSLITGRDITIYDELTSDQVGQFVEASLDKENLIKTSHDDTPMVSTTRLFV